MERSSDARSAQTYTHGMELVAHLWKTLEFRGTNWAQALGFSVSSGLYTDQCHARIHFGKSHIKKLSGVYFRMLRRLMQGKACAKAQHDVQEVKYEKKSDTQVLKYLQICSLETHLRVARLQLFRSMLKDKNAHEIYLACLLDPYIFETERCTNPWLEQLYTDFQHLSKFDTKCMRWGKNLLTNIVKSRGNVCAFFWKIPSGWRIS